MLDFIEKVDQYVIVAAAILGVGVSVYTRVRARLGKYKTTREILQEISAKVSGIDTRQQLILNTQIASVQETFGRSLSYWKNKGYIYERERKALKKLRDAYAEAGGNDLVHHFWEEIDALPSANEQQGGKHEKYRNNKN